MTNQSKTRVAVLLQNRVDGLKRNNEQLKSLEGPEFDKIRLEGQAKLEAAENELRAELEGRRVVVLGVSHELQDVGHHQNTEFGARLEFLVSAYCATIILEEWTSDRNASYASEFAKRGVAYLDVGTSGMAGLTTFVNAPITYPGHDGTLGPCTDAPELMEYGPLDVQENREHRMLLHIDNGMRNHRAGILVVGLAHLHSMAMKLRGARYRVAAYTWIGR